jgi:hypothetical protein
MQRLTRVAGLLLSSVCAAAAQPAVAGTLTPDTGAPDAVAAAPESGANSFTLGQARTRISDAGFTDVAGLKLDPRGVWRGTALQQGRKVDVWLDYTGKVGHS